MEVHTHLGNTLESMEALQARYLVQADINKIEE